MDSVPDQSEIRSSLKLVVRLLTRLLVYDLIASVFMFILFSSPNYNDFISARNIDKLIFTIAAVVALSGFIVLLLFAFSSQRTASTAIMTSQWGRSHKGPSAYSNEIISRQVKDWPALMAGFICVFFGLLIMGLTQ